MTEIIDAAIQENTRRQTTRSVSIFNGEFSFLVHCFFIQTGRAGSHCKSINSSELKLNRPNPPSV